MTLLNGLNVEASEFLIETGYMRPVTDGDRTKRIPVLSWVRAGHWKEAYEQEESREFMETDTNGEFALIVEGDSMEPEFREGDIIVVDPYKKQEQNDYVVVCNADYESTLKQLKKYGKTRVLHPLNPKYDDIDDQRRWVDTISLEWWLRRGKGTNLRDLQKSKFIVS